MNAHYLHKPDGTPTKWSQCGECGSVAAPGNYDLSVKCCTCYDCGGPLGKDEKVPYAYGRSLYHRACELKRRHECEAKQLEDAELIENYDGPVYYEGGHGSYGDGYFADVGELAEHLDMDDDQSSRPEFAHCCTEQPFPLMTADRLIESYCDDMDEEAVDWLEGRDELDKACAAFSELNKGVISWYVDYKRKVRVPGFPAAKAPRPTGGECGEL